MRLNKKTYIKNSRFTNHINTFLNIKILMHYDALKTGHDETEWDEQNDRHDERGSDFTGSLPLF